MNIKILTDMASDFTENEIDKYGIICLDMPLSINGEDAENISLNEFWNKLLNGAVIKTSQVCQQNLMKIFSKVKENNELLIAIFLSSKLSNTYNSAVLIKEELDYDGIYVMDSLCASIAEKVLVLKACELVKNGLDFKNIIAFLETFKTKIRLFACIDTLKFLARGGRINSNIAQIGNILRIKPLITFDKEGRIEIIAKKIGLNMAMKELLDAVIKNKIDFSKKFYPIFAYNDKNCDYFIELLKNKNKEIIIEEKQNIGKVIGTHIGPGGFGIVCFER